MVSGQRAVSEWTLVKCGLAGSRERGGEACDASDGIIAAGPDNDKDNYACFGPRVTSVLFFCWKISIVVVTLVDVNCWELQQGVPGAGNLTYVTNHLQREVI